MTDAETEATTAAGDQKEESLDGRSSGKAARKTQQLEDDTLAQFARFEGDFSWSERLRETIYEWKSRNRGTIMEGSQQLPDGTRSSVGPK